MLGKRSVAGGGVAGARRGSSLVIDWEVVRMKW